MKTSRTALAAALVSFFAPRPTASFPSTGGEGPTLEKSWSGKLEWRAIGPANMGGRITDLAVVESDPTTFWVATASGGLLKTTNNGTTFEHQFDSEATVSVGAMAVHPSDPNVVWVGTGEANPRNSVSWGDGVYKSTDGGKTWKNMGLKASFQIGAIAVHPADPNVVYVGALGRLWGDHEERGLYKTGDGGETWKRILSIDPKTGVGDIAMHPSDSETLLVATWERQRDGFDTNDPAKKWGPGSGLHRTSDGGATWKKVTAGLPTGSLGRMGIAWSRSNPAVLYLIVDGEKIGLGSSDEPYLGVTGENAEAGAKLSRVVADGPAAKAGLKAGDIVLAVDGQPVLSNGAFLAAIRAHKPEETAKIQASRERSLVEVEVALGKRPDPEARPYAAYLGGQRANIQEEQGPGGFETCGVYRSEDGGESWRRVNSLNPRPMYFSEVRVDPKDENRIYALGVSLHVSEDGGKTFRDDAGRGTHSDHHAMWIDPADPRHILLGNDGGTYVTWDRGKTWDHLNHAAIGQFYHVALDARADYRVYGGLQDNGSWGGPARTRSGAGPINADWIRVGGGDGFVCAVDPEDPDQVYSSSQNGGLAWRNLRTGRSGSIRPPREEGVRFRFNWRTPFVLSSHNTRIYYTAGNYVFRSIKGGEGLKRISPEITRSDRGSATALVESPLDSDILYVGTDDGALFGTRDGGRTWVDLFAPPPPPETRPAPEAETRPVAEPVEAAGTRSESQPAPAAGERPPGTRGGRFAEMLERADADGDGKIRQSELPERMQRMFERFDTDGSGAIEKAEIDAAMARGPFGGRRGEPGPAGGRTEPAAPAPSIPAPSADDPIGGLWKARLVGDGHFAGGDFDLTLRLEGTGAVTGEMRSAVYTGPIGTGSFDRASGELRFEFASPHGQTSTTARLSGPKLTGRIAVAGTDFAMEFEAERAGPITTAPAGEASPAGPGTPLKDLLVGPRWVASIEASRFAVGRVYLALDGHRSDDDAPYLFASEDHGRTWASIGLDLPAGSTRVLREDRSNANVLYAGTEFGAFVSIDRGGHWTELGGNLPTVAIHEFAQHPTSGEVVAATHGRSLWVIDATALRQIDAAAIAAPAHLYKPAPARLWMSAPARGASGARTFVGQNPPASMQVLYSLGARANEVSLKVFTPDGSLVRDLKPEGREPGLQKVAWDLRREPPARPPTPPEQPAEAAPRGRRPGAEPESEPAGPEPGSTVAGRARRQAPSLTQEPAATQPTGPRPFGGGPPGAGLPGGGPGGGFSGRGRFAPRVAPGTYVLVLAVDGREHKQVFTVEPDPDFPEAVAAGEDEEGD